MAPRKPKAGRAPWPAINRANTARRMLGPRIVQVGREDYPFGDGRKAIAACQHCTYLTGLASVISLRCCQRVAQAWIQVPVWRVNRVPITDFPGHAVSPHGRDVRAGLEGLLTSLMCCGRRCW